jgi:hypothetical protein
MMGVCRPAAADETRLLGDRSNVISVANPARRWQRQHAFIHNSNSPPFLAPIRTAKP